MSHPRPDRLPLIRRLREHLDSGTLRRWGAWLAGGLLAFGLLLYVGGPPLLKSLLVRQLSAELAREVRIERIDVNPYALSVQIHGLSVLASDGHEVVGFDRLVVNVSSASLVLFGAVLDEIHLENPRLTVVRTGPDTLDISDLLSQWMAPSEPSPVPRFSLNNIQVSGGTVTFQDRVVDRETVINDLALRVPFLSSLAYRADVFVEPHLSARLGDASFVLAGKSLPFSPDRRSELAIDLDDLALAPWSSYLQTLLPVQLKDGRLDTRLTLTFSQPPGEIPSLQLAGEWALRNFRLLDRQGGLLLAWQRLGVVLDEVAPFASRYDVRTIRLEGLDLGVEVNSQGQVNWLALAGAASGKPTANKAPESKPVQWSIGEVVVQGGKVRWRDYSGGHSVQGELLDIALITGAANSAQPGAISVKTFSLGADFGESLKVGELSLRDLELDTVAHRARLGSVSLTQGRFQVTRDAGGNVAFLPMPQLAGSGTTAAAGQPGPSWQFTVDRLAVAKTGLQWRDASTDPEAIQRVDDLTLSVTGLGNVPDQSAKVSLAASVNGKGQLKTVGQLALAPLSGQLDVTLDQLALLPLQPYFSEFLNVAVTRGNVSGKGQMTLATGKEGAQLSYRGGVAVNDFLAVDRVNNADFLRWRQLQLSGMEIDLAPTRIGIREIALGGFYSRLILGPDGRLNLLDILRKNGETVSLTTPPGRSVPARGGETDPSLVAAPAVPQVPLAAASSGASMPLRIDAILLKDGRVNFSDYFVKPNYAADLYKVRGDIKGLSSTAEAPASLRLEASYDRSAPVLITANLRPFAAKPSLDLQGSVKSVDMTSFSPYAGKYAGYNIRKGKLSLDVAYKLENGQLNADNRVFIDQLTFGDKVESPDATSLPVNLAIALLKNSRGEIDINLPISGSLDDPQFSVGGLIVRVIVNLFVKAVTSPFALLGSLFGGGEELAQVGFAPGFSRIEPAAEKTLESLAKAMTDRTGLKLEIAGRADPAVDSEGLKRAALDRAVRAQKQKALVRRGEESGSLREIQVSDDEYPLYLKQAYREADFKKPRNLIGLQKDLPVAEMEKLYLDSVTIAPDAVAELADQRAQRVQRWLIEQGHIAADRLFLLPPKVLAGDAAGGPGADFSLR